MVWLSSFKSECLKSRKTYEWPTAVLNILNNFNPENKILPMYLSDIQWFDYQQGIYEINNRKEVKSNDSSNSRSVNTSFDHIRSPQSHPVLDCDIKNMLLNTQIINEEFYHMTRNIRETDTRETKDVKLSSKMSMRANDRDSNNIGMKNAGYRHYSSCSLSEYLNNTFLHSGNLNLEENTNFNFMENLEKIEEREKQEQNMVQMKKCLFHYKGITEKIEQHLKDKKNFVFSVIQQTFTNYYCKKYGHLLSKKPVACDKISRKKIIDKIEFAFSELKDFIKCFQNSLDLFYKLHEYQRVLKYFLFTRENLQNFMTSLIFDEQIYEFVFEAQNFIDFELQNSLIEKLELIKDSQPSDFEVCDKYCLNEKTVKYFNEKKRVMISPENNILQSQNISDTQVFDHTESQTRKTSMSNNKFVLELKGSSIQRSEKGDIYDEDTFQMSQMQSLPYMKAIKNLRKIQKLKSPLHKLKNMRITAELIDQEIREFYQRFHIEYQGNIGVEEILPIHLYIISKANISSLFTHCALIDRFLSSNLTGSIAGYYLVTMQVCLKYILSLNKNGLY